MADPFMAEIRILANSYAPRGWADCTGQILSIAQNTALFSLLGVTYGGNGTVTFALPNLQDRVALGFNQGPGLSSYVLGESGGASNVTLLSNQIPTHNHTIGAYNRVAETTSPSNAIPARVSGETPYVNAAPNTPLATSIGLTGNSQSHNNMMPYLNLRYCIALQGVFPPRS
jgi:microcystin-dependent protein